jgi:MraZ protein
MLIGEYTHTLDEKNRLSLPSKFRKDLGKKVVVTRGLDRCLFVYSEKAWAKIAEKYGDLSIAQGDTRRFNRFMLSGAAEAEIDSAGRIVVPEFLKSFAKLGQKVILAGLYDRVEVWDQEAWNEDKKVTEGQADALAEKLGGLGVL